MLDPELGNSAKWKIETVIQWKHVVDIYCKMQGIDREAILAGKPTEVVEDDAEITNESKWLFWKNLNFCDILLKIIFCFVVKMIINFAVIWNVRILQNLNFWIDSNNKKSKHFKPLQKGDFFYIYQDWPDRKRLQGYLQVGIQTIQIVLVWFGSLRAHVLAGFRNVSASELNT